MEKTNRRRQECPHVAIIVDLVAANKNARNIGVEAGLARAAMGLQKLGYTEASDAVFEMLAGASAEWRPL